MPIGYDGQGLGEDWEDQSSKLLSAGNSMTLNHSLLAQPIWGCCYGDKIKYEF